MDIQTAVAFVLASGFSWCLIVSAIILFASMPPRGRLLMFTSASSGIWHCAFLTGIVANQRDLLPESVYDCRWLAILQVVLFMLGLLLIDYAIEIEKRSGE